MVSPLLLRTIVFANVIAFMAMSATLTMAKTSVNNFAAATFGTIGIYITLTNIKILGIGLYPSLLFCFIGGGIVGVATYLLLIKPLKMRGAKGGEIMIATLALDTVLIALLNIYADFLNRVLKVMSRDFTLTPYDFDFQGVNGVFIVSTVMLIAVLITLHLIYTRTSMGIALRAMGENPSLAECQGVDTERLCIVTWFLAGSLPAVAGGLFPVYWMSNPNVSVFIGVTVFGASILGGFMTIYDAIAGSYIVAFAQIALVSYLSSFVGSWVLSYQFLAPLSVIVITLLTFPSGIYGLPWDKLLEKVTILKGSNKRRK
ncbi:MAG: branched-chain amino acid ABC transporter permease [Candidatus Bathyarchaeota archaeon]|nr:branched-chain amino acid ABC transporter permease [Candidatus Bathyarchaeota archaeon]